MEVAEAQALALAVALLLAGAVPRALCEPAGYEADGVSLCAALVEGPPLVKAVPLFWAARVGDDAPLPEPMGLKLCAAVALGGREGAAALLCAGVRDNVRVEDADGLRERVKVGASLPLREAQGLEDGGGEGVALVASRPVRLPVGSPVPEARAGESEASMLGGAFRVRVALSGAEGESGALGAAGVDSDAQAEAEAQSLPLPPPLPLGAREPLLSAEAAPEAVNAG